MALRLATLNMQVAAGQEILKMHIWIAMEKSGFLYKVRDGTLAKLGPISLAFMEYSVKDRLVLRSSDAVKCPHQVNTVG